VSKQEALIKIDKEITDAEKIFENSINEREIEKKYLNFVLPFYCKLKTKHLKLHQYFKVIETLAFAISLARNDQFEYFKSRKINAQER
jgi:hypothetical protein